MLRYVMSTLLLAALLSAQNFVFVVPDQLDTEDAKTVFQNVVKLGLEGPAGAQVQIFNGSTPARVASFQVSSGRANSRQRERAVAQALPPIQAFLKRASSTNESSVGLRLPQTLATIGATLRSGREEVRILVWGEPRYSDKKDKACVIAKGYVPSDGHILSTRSESVFGTKDVPKLSATTLHWCTLKDNFANDSDREALRRFWTLWAHELGCKLVSFESDHSVAMERVTGDSQDQRLLSAATLNRSDTVLEMRSTMPSEAPAALKKVDPRIAGLAGVDINIVVDVSGSNTAPAAETEKNVVDAVHKFAPDVRVGKVTHGGVRYATHALASKEVAPEKGYEQEVSGCHPEWAIERGVALFDERSRTRARVLIVIGDVATGEAFADEREAIRSEARACGLVTGFCTTGGRLIVVYTGRSDAKDKVFYEDLLKAAGTRGSFVDGTHGGFTDAVLTALAKE